MKKIDTLIPFGKLLTRKNILTGGPDPHNRQANRSSEVDGPPECPICKGTGYVRMDVPFGHELFGKALPCRCELEQRKLRKQQQLAALSGIETLIRFRHASFDTYDPFAPGVHQAYLHAANFASHPQGWLLLVGEYGCGKTHLAVSIAKKQLEQGKIVIFQVVPHLLDYLRAGFASEGESYDERFQQLCDVDLLILDDFGAQSNTPWATEKLFQLLNHRYNAHAPTVITMNAMSWQHTDPRLSSRFHDSQLVRLVTMSQALDYRLHGKQEY